MPPFQRSGALDARRSRYPHIALNIPVIGLVMAFAMLLLVCLCLCCCSYRNKRYEQRPYRVDGARVGFTQLNSSLGSEESIGRQEVPEIKPENQSRFSKPPAYSVVNSPLLPSPQIFQSESMHLLCPSPTTPRALSPPPPTYSANR
jgi:hypothetical protein